MLLGSPSPFLLFCASAKAGIQASFDCPTTLIHHNSYWLCMHVLLAFLVCAKTVMMCISVMSLLFAHCVCVCANRCPSPNCTGSLSFQPNAAGRNSSMAQALAAGHSVDVVCCCGHAFCFACSADAHEPATCQQVQVAASGWSHICWLS